MSRENNVLGTLSLEIIINNNSQLHPLQCNWLGYTGIIYILKISTQKIIYLRLNLILTQINNSVI